MQSITNKPLSIVKKILFILEVNFFAECIGSVPLAYLLLIVLCVLSPLAAILVDKDVKGQSTPRFCSSLKKGHKRQQLRSITEGLQATKGVSSSRLYYIKLVLAVIPRSSSWSIYST